MKRYANISSAVCMLAAIGVFVCAGLAVDELDRRDAAKVADKELCQEIETKAVVLVQEEIWPIYVEKVEAVVLYDVPLDEEIQLYIVETCQRYGIAPEIVLAMIAKESSFRAKVVGDGGDSYGLMQIQPRWHEDRMERLGVDDLLNPYQNVLIGIDYLAELIGRENGIEWALSAYNAGPTGAYKGLGTGYAAKVLEISENLNEWSEHT